MQGLLGGKKSKKYDTTIRTFALTLHFYSPKGYRYVRTIFDNALPAVSTIRKWYTSINGKPGLSSEAFTALKLKADEANRNGKEILACILFDEMAIRKQEEFDEHNNQKIGQVNYGTNVIQTDERKFAKDALVYMVTGVNDHFKIPVAYFLIDGLNKIEKAALTSEVLREVSKSGIKIVGMTFDGLRLNFAMVETMGASIDTDKLYISNPHSDERIRIFPDACHMLKLIRNIFASRRILYDANNDNIEWKYLIELEKYQRENKINLANKLNKTHLQWDKKKMSVRLACETLSNSVADALALLRIRGVTEFLGCEPTIQFIRRINNVFDILNSMRESAIRFKRPISPDTKELYFKYFDESIEYIRELKLALSPVEYVLGSRSQTGFLGFIICMKNFRSFYMEYVDSNILPNVYTFRFSQDHLELLFGSIRQMVNKKL